MKKLALTIVVGCLVVLLGLSSNNVLGSALDPHDGSLDSQTHGAAGLVVNPQSREASRDFFFDYYQSQNPGIKWTGDIASCNPGATSEAFRVSVRRQINYFRAMAGVPAAVTFKAEYNAKAQSAALMMSANRRLNHFPPSSWRCYTAAGSEAASRSNLSLGSNGADSVAGSYMRDAGDGNYFAGHRRWLLFPQTLFMGSGDVPKVGESSSQRFVCA